MPGGYNVSGENAHAQGKTEVQCSNFPKKTTYQTTRCHKPQKHVAVKTSFLVVPLHGTFDNRTVSALNGHGGRWGVKNNTERVWTICTLSTHVPRGHQTTLNKILTFNTKAKDLNTVYLSIKFLNKILPSLKWLTLGDYSLRIQVTATGIDECCIRGLYWAQC